MEISLEDCYKVKLIFLVLSRHFVVIKTQLIRSCYILSTALKQMGYNLSPVFVSTVVWCYSTTGVRQLTFESFINCCISLQVLTNSFKAKDRAQRGRAQMNYEDFMCIAVSNAL